MNRIVISLLVGISILLQISNAASFEVATHRTLTTRAVRSSNLDDFLKTALGISGGVDEILSGQRIIQWIEDGSVREDDGIRFFNHFHNPLRAWSQAGLRILGGQLGSSSVLWGQRESQGAAWQNARDLYFEALTATTQEDRDANFAATLQILGNLIHLPQDAAVPAHTRNDQHMFFEGFERFVENIRTGTPEQQAIFASSTSTSQGFDPSILTLPQNPLAPIPIARIIDTTDPEQVDAVPSAGTDQGLAEYSNANFLSGDTIFKNFTFPRLESIDLDFPLTVNNRRYYTKIADGETNFFLVAEGTFTERLLSLASGDKGFVLDPRVYQDYARELLPRAIGYSAGLIEYFFRGFVGGFEVGNAWFPASNPPTTLIAPDVSNGTPDEETGDGTMVLVLTYAGQSGTTETFPSILVSSPVSVTVTRSPQTVTFPFTSLPFPATLAGGVSYIATVVYRGPLGMENGAVTVGGFCSLLGFGRALDGSGQEIVGAGTTCVS